MRRLTREDRKLGTLIIMNEHLKRLAENGDTFTKFVTSTTIAHHAEQSPQHTLRTMRDLQSEGLCDHHEYQLKNGVNIQLFGITDKGYDFLSNNHTRIKAITEMIISGKQSKICLLND